MAEEKRETQTVRQAPYLEEFQKKILEASFARGETPERHRVHGPLSTERHAECSCRNAASGCNATKPVKRTGRWRRSVRR